MSLTRPKSLTELVTEALRAQIISGALELGGQLSEAKIAKELAVSRTPVREAVNRLEMEGLLHVEPQRGSFVFNLKPQELAKLCDARLCLETAAMEAAISHAPKRLHTELSKCVDKMTIARGNRSDSDYLAHDTEFHQLFFDCAENRFLNDAYNAIAPKMAALRNRLGRHPDHMQKSYDEHIEMLAAIREQDKRVALSILKSHIGRKEGSYWLLETLDNQD